MVGRLEKLGRYELQQFVLYHADSFAGGESGTVGDAKDVRIDGHGRFTESRVHHDVGGLASNARQLLERLPAARHLPGVLLQQRLAGGDDVFGLVIKKTDRLDIRE